MQLLAFSFVLLLKPLHNYVVIEFVYAHSKARRWMKTCDPEDLAEFDNKILEAFENKTLVYLIILIDWF